jgi:hypothetical protein
MTRSPATPLSATGRVLLAALVAQAALTLFLVLR